MNKDMVMSCVIATASDPLVYFPYWCSRLYRTCKPHAELTAQRQHNVFNQYL